MSVKDTLFPRSAPAPQKRPPPKDQGRRIEPSVEDGMRQTIMNDARLGRIADEVRDYVPPNHPDRQPVIHPERISETTKIMCQAIDQIFTATAEGVDGRIKQFRTSVEKIEASVASFKDELAAGVDKITDEMHARVPEVEHGASEFKDRMRSRADELIHQIQTAMAHYDDVSTKMHDSPFNTPPAAALPKFLEQPKSVERPIDNTGDYLPAEDDTEGLATP